MGHGGSALALDKDLIRRVRQLDEYDLRRLVIFARGLLVYRDGPSFADASPPPTTAGTVTYRQQLVRCGRRGCTSCPHGPYWYGYWREDGRLRSRYIGKDLERASRLLGPAGIRPPQTPGPAPGEGPRPD